MKKVLPFIFLFFIFQLNAINTDSPLANPVAVDDYVSYHILYDTVTTIDVLSNDTDADGDTLTVVSVMGNPISTGIMMYRPDNFGNFFYVMLNSSGELEYQPDLWNLVQDTSFNYTISDGNGNLSTATVYVYFNCSGNDLDSDGDGVSDCAEYYAGTYFEDSCDFNVGDMDLTPTVAWQNEDCDGDGVINGDEIANSSNPLDSCDPNNMSPTCDNDYDGVSNVQEVIDGTNIDDFCDKIVANITLPVSTSARNNSDCDNDGLTYREETTGYNNSTTVANPHYITSDPNNPDTDGDGVIDGQECLDNTSQVNPCHFNMASISLAPTVFCNINNITGNFKFDSDFNGCDSSDLGIIHKKIKSTDGINSYATFTNSVGGYSLFTDEGNYTTTANYNIPNYFDVTPASYSSNFVGAGNTDIANFCLERTQIVNDVAISIYSSQARPGFNSHYYITCRNIGSTTISGDVVFTFDDSVLSFINATVTPTNQTVNTLSFDYNLAAFEFFSTQIKLHIAPPPTTNIGDILSFSVVANTNVTDDFPLNNTIDFSQTIIGSFDPNDITCLEGDQVLFSQHDKYLHYLIRFQNEGTADAINVVVTNILDDKLDWDTLELEGLSHDGRVAIKNDSEIEFIFESIHLPDSTTDEPNSHGFIAYKIKPKSDVALNGIISNQANIYFDFNEAVVTNIASTQFVDVLTIKEKRLLDFIIYPTPTSDNLKISSKIEISKIEIYTKLGQLVLSNTNQNNIDISNLSQGFYFCKVKDINGNLGVKKVIKR